MDQDVLLVEAILTISLLYKSPSQNSLWYWAILTVLGDPKLDAFEYDLHSE